MAHPATLTRAVDVEVAHHVAGGLTGGAGWPYASLMDITNFDDLLLAARQQPEPQRLLLVFAGASLPADATATQRARFEAGEGGELAPLMCVDKDPHALTDFASLVAEAETLGPPWSLVFAAALAGRAPLPPSDSQVDAALRNMVEAVRSGDIERYVPFDRQGQAVRLG
jgi:hypothetical protein